MAEYIEREKAEIIFRDARLALKPERCKDWNEYITRDMMLMNAEQAIHIIPSADVQPVRHGRWGEDCVGAAICSECGEFAFETNTHHLCGWFPPYCPNCGAKMEVDHD